LFEEAPLLPEDEPPLFFEFDVVSLDEDDVLLFVEDDESDWNTPTDLTSKPEYALSYVDGGSIT